MDSKEFDHLTHLCRIECTPEEREKFLSNMSNVLAYIAQLKEVDTEGVAPCNTVLETVTNVLREDEIGEVLARDTFLANAPTHVGGMIRVPPVIKFSN